MATLRSTKNSTPLDTGFSFFFCWFYRCRAAVPQHDDFVHASIRQTRDRSDSDVLSLTHEFLSDMLGVQRTSVTLIARQLQTEGLIRYRRGRVEIVDRDGLEKRSCECYEVTRRKNEEIFSHRHN
jgi:hypothetical protein